MNEKAAKTARDRDIWLSISGGPLVVILRLASLKSVDGRTKEIMLRALARRPHVLERKQIASACLLDSAIAFDRPSQLNRCKLIIVTLMRTNHSVHCALPRPT